MAESKRFGVLVDFHCFSHGFWMVLDDMKGVLVHFAPCCSCKRVVGEPPSQPMRARAAARHLDLALKPLAQACLLLAVHEIG